MNEEEKPMTADRIDMSGVDKKFHQRMRHMLRRHESMWNGGLGYANVAEHATDL